MGAATVELNGTTESGDPEVIEREVEEIRDNITGIVGELDRRGKELVDWRSHLQKHALAFGAVGAACLIGLGVTITVRRSRQKHRDRPIEKARRLRAALSRMIAHPELVARRPSGVGQKALHAAVGATVGFLTKALLSEMIATAGPADAANI